MHNQTKSQNLTTPRKKENYKTEKRKLQNISASLQSAETLALEGVTQQTAAGIDTLLLNLEKLKESKEDLGDLNVLSKTLETSFESGLTSAISDVIQGTKNMKQAFADMTVSILKSLADIIAKMIALKIIEAGTSLFTGGVGVPSKFKTLNLPAPQLRYGGVVEQYRYGGISKAEGYSMGGIARGRDSGYPAMLHGTEAVVPLPNNRSIPVDLKGTGQNNSVVVNVSIDGQGNATQDKQASSNQAGNMGAAIAAAVQKELQNQKRSGGILNPYGAA